MQNFWVCSWSPSDIPMVTIGSGDTVPVQKSLAQQNIAKNMAGAGMAVLLQEWSKQEHTLQSLCMRMLVHVVVVVARLIAQVAKCSKERQARNNRRKLEVTPSTPCQHARQDRTVLSSIVASLSKLICLNTTSCRTVRDECSCNKVQRPAGFLQNC